MPLDRARYGDVVDVLDSIVRQQKKEDQAGLEQEQDDRLARGIVGAIVSRPDILGYYYWTKTTVDIIKHASEHLPTVSLKIEDFPTLSGFCLFEEPIRLIAAEPAIIVEMYGFCWTWWLLEEAGKKTPTVSYGIVVRYSVPDLPINPTYMIDTPTSNKESIEVRPGELNDENFTPLEDDDFSREGMKFVRAMVAGMLFLGQHIIGTRRERLTRAEIRRQRAETPIEDILVMLLRRKDKTLVDPGSRDIEWTCRWIVSGHWRKNGERYRDHPTWIMPYIKGPEDKPLRVHADRLFKVAR